MKNMQTPQARRREERRRERERAARDVRWTLKNAARKENAAKTNTTQILASREHANFTRCWFCDDLGCCVSSVEERCFVGGAKRSGWGGESTAAYDSDKHN